MASGGRSDTLTPSPTHTGPGALPATACSDAQPRGDGHYPAAMGGGQYRAGARRPYPQRVYRPQFSFLQLSDQLRLQRLRFRKEVLRELCNVWWQDVEPHTRLTTVLTIEAKVTIALNFYATGSFQSATADIANISQFSAHCSIRQVTDALYRRRVDYISFPMTRDKQVERQARFARIAEFPRVQGAINCTHVGLRAPQHRPKIFVNRKGFHSLNVQLVCDHQRRILAIDVRYPGSSHDLFILHQTSVPTLFTGPNQDCGWLLGDKVYPPSSWLLTPLWNPRTAPEHTYNDAHSGTSALNICECMASTLLSYAAMSMASSESSSAELRCGLPPPPPPERRHLRWPSPVTMVQPEKGHLIEIFKIMKGFDRVDEEKKRALS
uniref:putative nuclease HARBI1 n=1 Tax=Pristiophorus japonicus TaxID=55135 RepID=UPI00398F42D5